MQLEHDISKLSSVVEREIDREGKDPSTKAKTLTEILFYWAIKK